MKKCKCIEQASRFLNEDLQNSAVCLVVVTYDGRRTWFLYIIELLLLELRQLHTGPENIETPRAAVPIGYPIYVMHINSLELQTFRSPTLITDPRDTVETEV